jgi:3-oxoacyl-[acyl-carrier protein] reductase
MSSPAEAIKAYVEAAGSTLGGIDMVVSNAAALAIGPSRKAFEANFQVDLLGCLALVDASMPYFKKSKAPSFVAISSVSARQSDDLNS